MIPKFRLDALTDGVFAVAMTLLVIDLRLPEAFEPRDAADLLNQLLGMKSQVLAYVISFYVLGLRWVGTVRLGPRGEQVGESYTTWALVHLLLVTVLPFSTMVVARNAALPPAIWLYAGTTFLMALVALRLVALAEGGWEARLGLQVIVLASLLAIGASFFIPRAAMLFYLVNLLDEPLRWAIRRSR